MGIFTLSNGDEFEIRGHNGKRAMIRVKRTYKNGPFEDVLYLPYYQELSDEIVVRESVLFGEIETYKVEDTFVIATNKKYREQETMQTYEGDVPEGYEAYYGVEVLLRSHEWHTRLNLHFHGNTNMFHIMCSLPQAIYTRAKEGLLDEQGITIEGKHEEEIVIIMCREQGDVLPMIFTKTQLEQLIYSVRLVEFELLKLEKI